MSHAAIVSGIGYEQPGAAIKFEGGDVLPIDVAQASETHITAAPAIGVDAVEHRLAAAVVVRP